MKIHIETDRLLLRELEDTDVHGMFELDADEEVHKFLGKNPIISLEEAKKNIDFIRKQYRENGIGRWAVVEKTTDAFLGWSGFKLITEPINGRNMYYDLGYRFVKKAWGKGYATETALASLNYGFSQLKQPNIYGMADVEHTASNKILQKIGMAKMNEFTYEGIRHYFYGISKNEWDMKSH